MERCEVCGNDYDKPLKILVGDDARTFDCFECAIHALAPICQHCGIRILGHGVEQQSGRIFCCAHCASQEGVTGLQDRV